MAEKIIKTAEEAWEYYEEHGRDLIMNSIKIAENLEYGVEIFLTAKTVSTYHNIPQASRETLMPEIIVNVDGELAYDDCAQNKNIFITIVDEIYEEYLSHNLIDKTLDFEDVPKEISFVEKELAIDDREHELDEAVFSLLEVVCPEATDIVPNPEELYSGLKDKICEYLYKEWELSVYRPMIVEDEDGKDIFLEYPYPEIELD